MEGGFDGDREDLRGLVVKTINRYALKKWNAVGIREVRRSATLHESR